MDDDKITESSGSRIIAEASRVGETDPSGSSQRPVPPHAIAQPDPSLLKPLDQIGFEFIQLHKPETMDKHGRRVGKAPLHRKWTDAPAGSFEDAFAWLSDGYNVGFRIRPDQLVLDIDPRNGGTSSLKKLEAALGCDFRLSFPTVETGSGGWHAYMSAPPDARTCETLQDYPGLEFKRHRRQVVAPGSVHPETGRHYYMYVLSSPFDILPMAPANLLDLIRKQSKEWPAESGSHSPEELEEMLTGLNPADFSDHQAWLNLMMSCHFATAGSGRQEFIGWSVGDPVYSDHEWQIGNRWDFCK